MNDRPANEIALNRLLDQFDEAWQLSPVELAAFWTTLTAERRRECGLAEAELLAELVRADLEHRWRPAPATGASSGSQTATQVALLRVEDYLNQFPLLRSAALLPLVCAEFRARHGWGDRPAIADYCKRFPALAGDLEAALSDLQQAIDEEHQRRRQLPATADFDTPPVADTHAWPERPLRAVPALPEVDDYELLEVLGRGGMGMVIKARHKLLRRLVAIKIPLAHTLDDGGERFLREARAVASLRNPHLCAIHEVRQTEQFPYIVLAYVDGQTLTKWVASARPNAREYALLVAKVARAVHYAHQQGVIHRDIKPGNIMVESASGEPVLMDFGLAKEIESGDAFLTRSGQVLGTPAFMSPEQAAGRLEAVGPATDVYALGAVLYWLICGRPPFDGTAGELIHKVQSAEPTAPRKLVPQLHRDLETICQKAMRKEADARYSSALALADDLERFAAGEAILTRPLGLVHRAARRAARQPVATAVVAASLLAIVATLLWTASAWRGQQQLAALRGEFAASLDNLTTASAEAAGERLTDLDTLAAAIAARSGSSAEPLQAEVTARLRLAIEQRLNTERLAESDAAALERLITLLSPREAAAGRRLSHQLRSKRAGWHAVAELSGGLSELANRFAPGFAVEVDEGVLVRQPSDSRAHFPAVAVTEVPSVANVRVEGVFADLPPGQPFGLVLDSAGGHTGDILTLDIAPGGQHLASGSVDGTLKVWDIAGRSLLRTRHFPGVMVTQAAFVAGNLVVIRTWSQLFIYDWEADTIVASHKSVYLPFALSADRQLVATGDLHEVAVLELPSGRRLGGIPQPPDARWSRLVLSNDRRTLIAAQETGPAQVWDWTTAESIHTLSLPENGKVGCLAFSEQLRTVAVGQDNGHIGLFDVDSGRPQAELATPPQVREIALSPDGRLLAALFGGAGGIVWDVAKQTRQFELAPSGWGMMNVRFDDDGRHILAASDSRVVIWDATTGRKVRQLAGQRRQLRALTSHGPTGLVVCGGRDHLVHLHHMQQGHLGVLGADRCKVVAQIDASAEPPVADVQLHQGGTLIASQRVPLPTDSAAAGAQRLRVQRVHGLIKVWLNPPTDEAPASLEFHEVFPAPAGGTFGVVWPRGARLTELMAYRREAAAASERLELAEKFYAERRYDVAAEMYAAVAASTAEEQTSAPDSLWQEATYKEAVARQAAGDRQTAEALFERLRQAPGERWSVYALVQLWTIRLREGRVDEAEALISSAQQQGVSFAQVAALLSDETRVQLIAAVNQQVAGVDSYYTHVPHRVLQMQRLMEVERLVYGRPGGATRLRLIRALRFAGDNQAAKAQAREWLADEPASPSGDAIDELAWILREEGEFDAAAELLRPYLPAAGQEPDARGGHPPYRGLWVDMSYVEIARGDHKAAARCIENFLSAMGDEAEGLSRHSPRSALVSGFLLADLGRHEEARQVWAAGHHALTTLRGTQRRTPVDWLFYWLLASLSEEGDDEAMEAAFQSLMRGLRSDSTMTSALALITATPSGQSRIARRMKLAWQSERGRELARRIAYQQVSFRELLREPAVLLAVELAGPLIRPGGLSAEEDRLLWDMGERFHDALIVEGRVSSDKLSALAAAQAAPFFLLGALRQFDEIPELAAPLAYFSGVRQLHQQRDEVARRCFEMAVSHAGEGAPLARLAEAELATLKSPP